MTIHELRDESGNVIHAFATASFPLPSDHWIYKEPIEPTPLTDSEIQLSHDLRLKMRAALKYTIQVCTSRGKDMDFDPDAMCMTLDQTLFQRDEQPSRELSQQVERPSSGMEVEDELD